MDRSERRKNFNNNKQVNPPTHPWDTNCQFSMKNSTLERRNDVHEDKLKAISWHVDFLLLHIGILGTEKQRHEYSDNRLLTVAYLHIRDWETKRWIFGQPKLHDLARTRVVNIHIHTNIYECVFWIKLYIYIYTCILLYVVIYIYTPWRTHTCMYEYVFWIELCTYIYIGIYCIYIYTLSKIFILNRVALSWSSNWGLAR